MDPWLILGSEEETAAENDNGIEARFIRSNFLTKELTELPEGFGLMGRNDAKIFCCSDIGIRNEAA